MNCIKAFLHKHPAGIFVALVLAAAVALVFVDHANQSQTLVVVLGGVIGAWLNILDVLSDHRTLKVKASGLKPVTWHDVFYLSGRTILGGMSGLVVFNVWGITGSGTANEFTRLLSLGILAGFSTTTLAKLSKAQTEHEGKASAITDDEDDVTAEGSEEASGTAAEKRAGARQSPAAPQLRGHE